MGSGMRWTRRFATAMLLALAASAGLSLAPAAAPGLPALQAIGPGTVRAAGDDIDIGTTTRYVVVPSKARIRVTVDIVAVNQHPTQSSGGVITRYYYDGLNLGVQPEATNLKATQGGTQVQVTSTKHKTYRLLTILFRSNLYFGQTAKVRLTFDLPTGAPRSASDVRVGAAFASFLAWAFGDHGSVRIEVPAGFDVNVSGANTTAETESDGTQVLTATTAAAADWYAWVDARNDAGLTSQVLHLADGEQITVRAWPEDNKWRRRVSRILTDGVPHLVQLIGLPWPVRGSLNVLEIHTPLLEGYAGFYDSANREITISEELDDLTIVHEASHAWFNADLFTERWITEGLADEYAARVLADSGQQEPAPDKVKPTAKVAFPLSRMGPAGPDLGRRERRQGAVWIRRVVDRGPPDRRGGRRRRDAPGVPGRP